MASPRLQDLGLVDFGARLAERTPTPGGGSVAAHLAQLGAALVAMAFRFTSGEKFAAHEAGMALRAEELDRIRSRAAELIDEDTAAYDLVTRAYRLPKATDDEKRVRAAAIQTGLRAATGVPAETLALALRALELAAAGAGEVNPNLVSDCLSGAWCLRGAAEAAFLNIRINAGSLADKAEGERQRQTSQAMLASARALAESVVRSAEGKLA